VAERRACVVVWSLSVLRLNRAPGYSLVLGPPCCPMNS
jgi:hypothetical protein